ncbi:uncharacterized protein MELLADRAFT_85960 [Melampsora larici-populina 98AG31]|uniref:Uncharacterized protein n=1 Tax=Melampsora larici-populina (strain 98AG31 / pathotype 3-4-7) TaxID=747676 RepID=F4RKA3_MELLP|nr:uncharacterized protein MELLADRAFT_85960 [Melampsora larici-populina 98AG31]EGG07215.1 hypothetical protein MELLADRAFT_85960 [Melampsora larici-populina 98AG31]
MPSESMQVQTLTPSQHQHTPYTTNSTQHHQLAPHPSHTNAFEPHPPHPPHTNTFEPHPHHPFTQHPVPIPFVPQHPPSNPLQSYSAYLVMPPPWHNGTYHTGYATPMNPHHPFTYPFQQQYHQSLSYIPPSEPTGMPSPWPHSTYNPNPSSSLYGNPVDTNLQHQPHYQHTLSQHHSNSDSANRNFDYRRSQSICSFCSNSVGRSNSIS